MTKYKIIQELMRNGWKLHHKEKGIRYWEHPTHGIVREDVAFAEYCGEEEFEEFDA